MCSFVQGQLLAITFFLISWDCSHLWAYSTRNTMHPRKDKQTGGHRNGTLSPGLGSLCSVADTSVSPIPLQPTEWCHAVIRNPGPWNKGNDSVLQFNVFSFFDRVRVHLPGLNLKANYSSAVWFFFFILMCQTRDLGQTFSSGIWCGEYFLSIHLANTDCNPMTCPSTVWVAGRELQGGGDRRGVAHRRTAVCRGHTRSSGRRGGGRWGHLSKGEIDEQGLGDARATSAAECRAP